MPVQAMHPQCVPRLKNAMERNEMSRARQHILVIEDNPQLGRFITVALQAAGWTTLGPIGDYAAALEATRAAPFDLALVDLACPERTARRSPMQSWPDPFLVC